MVDRFAFDVFLSHSSKDQSVVRGIAERLRADGIRVWLDEWEIHPGDHIPAKIEEGLEHSRLLVLCMSAHVFGCDWAQLETATFRFRDPLNKDRRFIPLRLDDAPIKGSLAHLLYISWLPADQEQEYRNLLEACRPPAKPMLTLEGHSDSITALKWVGGGNSLLSTSYDGSVCRWDIFRGTDLIPTRRVVWKSTDRILALAIHVDDSVAVFSRNGDITVLNSPNWKPSAGAFQRVCRSPTVYSASWLSDEALVTAEDDGIARIIDRAGTVQREFVGHKSRVRTITLF